MGTFLRKTLVVLLVAGIALPQAQAEPCACDERASAAEDPTPPCCQRASAPADACCSADNGPTGCCGAGSGPCGCDDCHGPRQADPLVMSVGGWSPDLEFSALPPTPPASLADDDASARLAAWAVGLNDSPPPDLRAMLCVWTL